MIASARESGSPADDEEAAAPTSDLSANGPKGSGSLFFCARPPAGDRLCPPGRRPPRGDSRPANLMEGTDLRSLPDVRRLVIATPDPLDPSVTFLAARHRLDDAALKARSPAAPRRPIVIRLAHPGGAARRRAAPAREAPPGAAPSRDDRLIVLASPGLAIVTPPAYRALLLAPNAPASSTDGGAGSEAASPGFPEPRPTAARRGSTGRRCSAASSRGGAHPVRRRADGERGRHLQDGDGAGGVRR